MVNDCPQEVECKENCRECHSPGNAEPQLGFKSKREGAKDKTAELGLCVPGLDVPERNHFLKFSDIEN